jgi:hypothetical protein
MVRINSYWRARRLLLGVGVAAALPIAGIAYASIPDSNGVIHGCFSPNGAKGTGGTELNIVDTDSASCSKGQQEVTWNKMGPQGPQGPEGPQGPQGPPGAPGTPGAVGYEGTRIPIAFLIPATYASLGHITLPAGSFIVSATASFNNPTGSDVLVQCAFVGGHEAALRLEGAKDPFDAGGITLDGTVVSSSQASYDLSCRSIGASEGASAQTVGGEITSVQVDEIRNLG